MMDSTQLALLVLVAVSLGALLPLAFQMMVTVNAAKKLIAGVEPRLTVALEELSAAAISANRSMSALDAVALQRAAESVVEIGNLAKKARDITASIELASAVGAAAAPAIAALIRAWRTPGDSEPGQTTTTTTTTNQDSPNPHSERPVSIHRKEMDHR